MLRIRKPAPQDAYALAAVHIACWKTAYAGIVDQDYLDALSVDKKKLRWDEILTASKENEFTLAAELDGSYIGFLGGGPNRDTTGDCDGELISIYLLAEHRGKGYGTALYQAACKEFRRLGFTKAVVWVLKDNPSRSFYEKLGARLVAEKEVTIGKQTLAEVAYAWDNLEG